MVLEDVDVGAVCGLADVQDGAVLVEGVPLVLAAVVLVGDVAVIAVLESGGHCEDFATGGVGGGGAGALDCDGDGALVFDELMGAGEDSRLT